MTERAKDRGGVPAARRRPPAPPCGCVAPRRGRSTAIERPVPSTPIDLRRGVMLIPSPQRRPAMRGPGLQTADAPRRWFLRLLAIATCLLAVATSGEASAQPVPAQDAPLTGVPGGLTADQVAAAAVVSS